MTIPTRGHRSRPKQHLPRQKSIRAGHLWLDLPESSAKAVLVAPVAARVAEAVNTDSRREILGFAATLCST